MMFRQRKPKRYYGEQSRSRRRVPLVMLLLLVIVAAGLWLWREPWIARIGFATGAGNEAAQATPLPPRVQPSQPVVTEPTQESAVLPPAPTLPPSPTTDLLFPGSSVVCPADCARLGARMLDLVNRERATQGLAPLDAYEPANLAAQAHAVDMIQRRYFDHISPDGSTPSDRLDRMQAGSARATGENIWAFKVTSSTGPPPITNWDELVARAQNDWMNSPGHRANILNAVYTRLGVGIAYDAVQGEVRMVQVFFTPAQ